MTLYCIPVMPNDVDKYIDGTSFKEQSQPRLKWFMIFNKTYEVHMINFQTFFVWTLLLIVHT